MTKIPYFLNRVFKKFKSSKFYSFLRAIYHKLYQFKPIKGKGNVVLINRKSKTKIKLDIVGNHNTIEIDFNSKINCLIYIRGNNHVIKIGKNVRINSGELWIEDDNVSIVIGENTTIESSHIAATEPNSKIIIGTNCMFSTNVVIRTGDSHSIIDNLSNKRINYAKNVKIENHVWLGDRCTILKGVTIGENAIVSTGAVVTNDVLPNTIVGGIPAKVIKENISWSRERIYEKGKV